MGGGNFGAFGATEGASTNDVPRSSISDNAKAMKDTYPYTKEGKFGVKGKNVRIIKTSTSKDTAEDFYHQISKGGTEEPLSNGKGVKTTLDDGTIIVHRPVTSTPDSPAVEIQRSASPEIADQKIHFIKEP